MEEIHAFAALGALDLFLEVVVDAEALEVIDGDHDLPVALLTLMENLLDVRQALLQVCFMESEHIYYMKLLDVLPFYQVIIIIIL